MAPLRTVPLFRIIMAVAVLVAASSVTVEAQARGSLAGTVVDDTDGSPLEGAVVSVLETELSAEADDEGRFLLPGVPAGAVTVKVEHAGYSAVVERVEVSSTGVSYLRARLPRMETMLRELMVRAGREDDGGSSEGEVRGEDGTSKTAADLLAQDVPGVEIGGGEGVVGAGSQIRLRGVSSISLSNAPAIYLDGVRIDEGARQSPGARGMAALHVLQTISASDVERIRVLRGPSAAAQYAESANGVILVETRRGNERGEGDEGGG